MFAADYPEFAMVTCLEWNILAKDLEKDIVIDSMRFLVRAGLCKNC